MNANAKCPISSWLSLHICHLAPLGTTHRNSFFSSSICLNNWLFCTTYSFLIAFTSSRLSLDVKILLMRPNSSSPNCRVYNQFSTSICMTLGKKSVHTGVSHSFEVDWRFAVIFLLNASTWHIFVPGRYSISNWNSWSCSHHLAILVIKSRLVRVVRNARQSATTLNIIHTR